ncbi:hypothetical protein CLOM_g8304 [Closterium sp. NIES-68]|nr:hypothetical protein CLOM_g8304 [Closterium sp. NIES-68]
MSNRTRCNHGGYRQILKNGNATTEETAHLFFHRVAFLHGIPRTLISDRDPKFTSKFWKELIRLLGTRLAMSSTYHPPTDGQTEQLNQVVEQSLRVACKDETSKWDQQLPLLEISYNNSTHSATGQTPFFLCYKQHPLTPHQPVVPAQVQPAYDFITAMHQHWDTTQKRLRRVQTSQVEEVDKSQMDHQIQIGDPPA